MRRLRRAFFRAPIVLYRLGLGWLLGRRILLLVHTGRKSGVRREAVLEVVDRERTAPIVVSGFGGRSDWLLNLRVNPDVEVVWGRRRFAARASVLAPEEAVEMFRRYGRDHPRTAQALGSALGVSILGDPDGAAKAMPVVRLDPVPVATI